MDTQLIQLIARLKIQFRREKGSQINTQRFFDDPAYRLAVLDEAEASDSEELVTLAITLRDRLGMIAATVPITVPAPILAPATGTAPVPPAARNSASDGARYRFGARS